MKFRFLVTYDVPTDFRNKHSITSDDVSDWQLAVEEAARNLIPTAAGAVWVERFEEEMDWRKMNPKSAPGALNSAPVEKSVSGLLRPLPVVVSVLVFVDLFFHVGKLLKLW